MWEYIQTHWHALVSGAAGLAVISWLSSYLTGAKAVAFVHEKIDQLTKKINENSILSQIHADDAVTSILESVLMEVLHDADDEIKTAIASGDISSINWKQFGQDVWAKAQLQIKGGANDYLKSSSFQDGAAIAAMIAERFFKKQAVQNAGLVTDAPRAETPAPSTGA